MRARGTISPSGGHQAHLNALAYMSDSYFIGTVPRIHGLINIRTRGSASGVDVGLHQAARTKGEVVEGEAKCEIGMMVSLDHSIFFHGPRDFRADQWMFCEMESPWAGDGRGVVHQRIFTRDGRLIATCAQEVSDAWY